MKQPRKRRKPVQPATNYSYWKRQLPDLFDASDSEQYEHFRNLVTDFSNALDQLVTRLEEHGLTDALASGKLKIVNIDELPFSDDDDADEEL